jgi:energy-coupling factor transporter ATP-binding protein EcfA2
MYVERINLETVRTFVSSKVAFVHPDSEFRASRDLNGHQDLLPKPRLPNVNLLLGDNGSGKTTILQAIALASLGPAARDSKLAPPDFVRLPRTCERLVEPSHQAIVSAFLKLQPQDSTTSEAIYSTLAISRKGELERIDYIEGPDGEDPPALWDPVFKSDNDAYFCAAYGSTRRAESSESLERGGAPKPPFVRGRRLQSIFEDSFPLFPLIDWLPALKKANPAKFAQVVKLINLMLGSGHYRFTGRVRGGEYLFERGGTKVPFRSLSDGYRSFIAWVADLLYHISYACPKGKKLRESVGVVLVDEIDLGVTGKARSGI